MTTAHNKQFDVLVMGDLFTPEQRTEALAAFADNQLDTTFVADLADGSDDHPNTLRRATTELTAAGYGVDSNGNALRVASPIPPTAPRTKTELADRIDSDKAVQAVCNLAAIFGATDVFTSDHLEAATQVVARALAGTDAPGILTASLALNQYWEGIEP